MGTAKQGTPRRQALDSVANSMVTPARPRCDGVARPGAHAFPTSPAEAAHLPATEARPPGGSRVGSARARAQARDRAEPGRAAGFASA